MKIIRTCNIIPFNKEKNQILLLQTKEFNEKLTFPNRIMHKLDSDDDTIKSIAKEELNVGAKEFTLLKKENKTSKNKVIKSIYFTISIEGEIKLNEEKFVRYTWFDLDQNVLEHDFLYNEKTIIEELIKNQQK